MQDPMTYVDGFVLAVPTTKRDLYQQYARDAARLFREHGALSVVEAWGEDVPDGKWTSFPMAVKREPDETVVFAWITWPSRAVRDEAHRRFAEDPRMNLDDMPFDGKRMIYGGFEVLVNE